jgi:hypothetical protein
MTTVFADLTRDEVLAKGIEYAAGTYTGTKEHAVKLAVAWARHNAVTIDGVAYDDAHRGLSRAEHWPVQKAYNAAVRAHWKLY